MENEKFVTLDDAVENPGVRQKFLTRVFHQKIPYCSGIYYDPDESQYTKFGVRLLEKIGIPQEQAESAIRRIMQSRTTEFVARSHAISHYYNCKQNFPLFVGDFLFSGDFDLQELMHVILAHEGRHLEQNSEGLPYFNNDNFRKAWIEGYLSPRIVTGILELDANYYSLLRIQRGDFQVREKHLSDTVRKYNQLGGVLCKARFKNTTQSRFIQAVLTHLPLQARVEDLIFKV